jgi:MFS family permease
MGDRRLDRFRAVAGPRARQSGGLLQCGTGLGSILAPLVWLGITSNSLGAWLETQGPNAWRYPYLIGVLPALVVLWIRRNIPESPRWEEANERRRLAATNSELMP